MIPSSLFVKAYRALQAIFIVMKRGYITLSFYFLTNIHRNIQDKQNK
jgi:hypothetical protein